MVFFFSLLIEGALSGAIYALIALAFVLVYKASRMINFAIGEWVMWGAALVAAGVHAIGLGLGTALGFACAGMTALAFGFTWLVLRRMRASPAIASIMITLALGAVMRWGRRDNLCRGAGQGHHAHPGGSDHDRRRADCDR